MTELPPRGHLRADLALARHYGETTILLAIRGALEPFPPGAGLVDGGSRGSHRLRERVHLRDDIRRGAPQARYRAIAAASPGQLAHGQFDFPDAGYTPVWCVHPHVV